jgi:hypothetical protein
MRHLSDDLIQQYLDSPLIVNQNEVESHLLVCFECREKLEQYQKLYLHLSVESEVVPDKSFNLSVLAAVGRIESKKKSRQLVQIAGALSGIMLLVLSLNYFGLISWQGLLSAVKSTSANIFNPFYETVGLLVEKLNGNLELLAFAGLALLLFQLLDHSLLKHKVNRT